MTTTLLSVMICGNSSMNRFLLATFPTENNTQNILQINRPFYIPYPARYRIRLAGYPSKYAAISIFLEKIACLQVNKFFFKG